MEMRKGRGMLRRMLVGLTVTAASLAGAGCGLYYTNEYRSLDLEASGTAGAAVTRASFQLYERKGEGQFAMWSVEVSPFPTAPVVAARLRAGTADAKGGVLYLFPLKPLDANGPDYRKLGVVAQELAMTDYRGTTRFEDLWDRLQKEPTFVEVELGGGAAPIAIGPLRVTSEIDWRRDRD